MSLTETLSDGPAYVGLLAVSTGCILLLGVYLVTTLLEIPFDFVVSPAVLAAIATIFAAAAIAISDENDSASDDG